MFYFLSLFSSWREREKKEKKLALDKICVEKASSFNSAASSSLGPEAHNCHPISVSLTALISPA